MSDNNIQYRYGGIGMGSIIAMVLSYLKWHSLGWLIVHGFFSWFYVIYYAIKYGAMI